MAEGVEHIAGPYTDGLQLCVRCGEVLTDGRSTVPMLRGWAEGEGVVHIGGGAGRLPYWVVSSRFEGEAEPCRSDA